jgi:hypothetical protein
MVPASDYPRAVVKIRALRRGAASANSLKALRPKGLAAKRPARRSTFIDRRFGRRPTPESDIADTEPTLRESKLMASIQTSWRE